VKRRVAAVLVLAALLAGAVAVLNRGGGRHRDEGAVHFLGSANRSFDQYTASQDPSYGVFLRRHMWRMVAFSPYFDNKTAWYPNGWAYDDAYAIYRSSALATRHPEWILRDGAGNQLYIPFECSNGTCSQYAADISNPAFRTHWIADAEAAVRHGYRGLYIDDVNMAFRVGDGQGHQAAPIDSQTKQPMTYEAWRSYMAQFMEEIRAALPHTEIAHNAIWFADSPTGTADPYIRREIRAADYINLERGVNDGGLTGGAGPGSLKSFMDYIDVVHGLGKGVVLDGHATDRQGSEYSLASYFLVSTGHDLVSVGGMTPIHWWTALDVNLGEALGPRRRWSGVLRRDFSRGMTLVNGPGSESHAISLPSAMRDLDGHVVKSVILQPTGGVVLRTP
jgi:hypothetical protein